MGTTKQRTLVEDALLDVDGSCRDLNVDRSSWEGVRMLLDRLRPDFESAAVGSTNHDTEDGRITNIDRALDVVESSGGYVQILLNGGTRLLTHLQLFVSTRPGEPLFLEVTFFPKDLSRQANLFDAFTSWAEALCSTVGGTRYFVRYENASWQFGDTGPYSGVFLVQDVKGNVSDGPPDG